MSLHYISSCILLAIITLSITHTLIIVKITHTLIIVKGNPVFDVNTITPKTDLSSLLIEYYDSFQSSVQYLREDENLRYELQTQGQNLLTALSTWSRKIKVEKDAQFSMTIWISIVQKLSQTHSHAFESIFFNEPPELFEFEIWKELTDKHLDRILKEMKHLTRFIWALEPVTTVVKNIIEVFTNNEMINSSQIYQIFSILSQLRDHVPKFEIPPLNLENLFRFVKELKTMFFHPEHCFYYATKNTNKWNDVTHTRILLVSNKMQPLVYSICDSKSTGFVITNLFDVFDWDFMLPKQLDVLIFMMVHLIKHVDNSIREICISNLITIIETKEFLTSTQFDLIFCMLDELIIELTGSENTISVIKQLFGAVNCRIMKKQQFWHIVSPNQLHKSFEMLNKLITKVDKPHQISLITVLSNLVICPYYVGEKWVTELVESYFDQLLQVLKLLFEPPMTGSDAKLVKNCLTKIDEERDRQNGHFKCFSELLDKILEDFYNRFPQLK